ncbi:2'-5' RNA ligase family protein [Planococcus sp. APC 4015]|nr:2'-5' RNA ligase family protein [Planococcus sp. APC 4015]
MDHAGVVSIELILDDASDELVRADWRRLADAGHSSLAAHTAASNRPHITVLVRPALASLAFTEAVAMLPLRVSLGEPIVFAHGDRGVLARPVTPTDGLLALHRAVHEAAGPGEDEPHTSSEEWMPHVTLARRLRLTSLDSALALLGGEHDATVVALRRWDSATRTVTPLG